MPKTQTNTLRLPPETVERLKQMAREKAAREHRDVKWTDLVRAAIDGLLVQAEARGSGSTAP